MENFIFCVVNFTNERLRHKCFREKGRAAILLNTCQRPLLCGSK